MLNEVQPDLRQSRTKPLLLCNTSFAQKRGFVRFCLFRPRRPRPRPGGSGAFVRGPAPASPWVRSGCLPGRGAARSLPVAAARPLLAPGFPLSRRQHAGRPAPQPLAGGPGPWPCRPPGSASPAVGLPPLPARPGPGGEVGALGAATPYRASSPAPRPPRAADRRLSFRSKS